MTSAGAVRAAAARAAAAVVELRGRVASQHAAGVDPLATWTLATDLFDRLIGDLWESIITDLPAADMPPARRVSLVAVGGYGRREMAPWSDVDLMLLHDGSDPRVLADLASRVMQDLFDAGLQVGQSVRTAGEALSLAGQDATILSGLLDGRLVVGPGPPFDQLAARLRRMVRRSPRQLAALLLEARREEAGRHGQTVSLLEPNVKRSPGGLRDIQLIRWLGVILHEAETFDELAAAGGISRDDLRTLRDAAAFLARVRTDLHLAASRAADDLTRDQQACIAVARGIEDRDGLLGVERFMRDYIGHTRTVQRIAERTAVPISGSPAVGRLAARLLGHTADDLYRVGPADVAALRGRVDRIAADPAAIIRLLELGLLHGLPVEPATWVQVATLVGRDTMPSPDADSRAAFLRLFVPPAGAVATWRGGLADLLRRLHDVDVLERFVPGFAHARDLLQFNNYHKYTIDEHCILAVERCLESADDEGWLGRAWRGLTRPRPLLLALLFHDLGKGYPGDHSEVGAEMARAACERLGVPVDEAEIIEFLVRKHLLMAHLAFRRDLGDESIVAGFARDVGSPEILRMLALLTAADVAAVGPGTWTTWKADLLGGLYDRTREILAGDPAADVSTGGAAVIDRLFDEHSVDDPVRRLARMLPAAAVRGVAPIRLREELGRLARLPAEGVFVIARWQPDTATVSITIGTDERVAAGLFHRVTAALAGQRLEVLAADIHTLADGHVLDRFTVADPDFTGEPPAERLTEISAAIRTAVLAAEAPRIQRQWNPFAPQLPPATRGPVRVLFDNESSGRATIVEVFAHDSPGLLSQVARVLYDAGLSVQAARIGTYLDQIVDAFHVTDVAGRKVTDPRLLAGLRERLERSARLPGE
ncbi:MAG: [protein-PII] uridylyltransferase [Planctomycetes bacterium]|nr:[protein-PII] uridylyltransferase [Planctomycetota bacterium]